MQQNGGEKVYLYQEHGVKIRNIITESYKLYNKLGFAIQFLLTCVSCIGNAELDV